MPQDGLKLAQDGRKLDPKMAQDGPKFASRWLQAGPMLALGPHLRSKKPQVGPSPGVLGGTLMQILGLKGLIGGCKVAKG